MSNSVLVIEHAFRRFSTDGYTIVVTHRADNNCWMVDLSKEGVARFSGGSQHGLTHAVRAAYRMAYGIDNLAELDLSCHGR